MGWLDSTIYGFVVRYDALTLYCSLFGFYVLWVFGLSDDALTPYYALLHISSIITLFVDSCMLSLKCECHFHGYDWFTGFAVTYIP
jgi:hypothetical protein